MSAQEKLIQVLEYIQEAEGLMRRPAFTVPTDHFCGWEHELRGMEGVAFDLAKEGEQVWLRIDRLAETKPPQPPANIEPWIILSRSADKEPSLKEGIVLPGQKAGETIEKNLEDYPAIKSAFATYLETSWRQWSAKESIRRKTITLYNRLFTLQQVMESESTETPLELVWGVGMVLWAAPGKQAIRYPLITQLCEINVNETDYALEIRPRELEPTLEIDPLAGNEVQGIVTVEEAWRKFWTSPALLDVFQLPFCNCSNAIGLS